MKIICPKCDQEFHVTEKTAGKKAKCSNCDKIFRVEKPQPPYQKADITAVWAKCPPAFKTAFLATLGVISALVISYYFADFAFFKKNNEASNAAESLPIERVSTDNIDRDIVLLFYYIRDLETIRFVRTNFAQNHTSLRTLRAFKRHIKPLADRLEFVSDEVLNLDFKDRPELNGIRVLYVTAMRAEVDVLDDIILFAENGEPPDDYLNTIKKSDTAYYLAYEAALGYLVEL